MTDPALNLIPQLYAEEPPPGEIVAQDVSPEVYMQRYEGRYEWVQGYVIRMPGITLKHDQLIFYLRQLFSTFFALRPVGRIVGDPFLMRLDAVPARRQPDLQIILHDNPGQLTETEMIGPADICIEVVSPVSLSTDYGAKFAEYEAGGVREYWLLDYMRTEAFFYRRGDSGLFALHRAGTDGMYESPLLPDLRLHVPTLWQDTLPNALEVVTAVQAMLPPT